MTVSGKCCKVTNEDAGDRVGWRGGGLGYVGQKLGPSENSEQ